MNIRTRICLIVLLVTPLLTYWSAIFSTYGIRDDYAHIRVAREEPGELIESASARGRVLNGALLDTSFAKVDTVDELVWLRSGGLGLLLLAGLATWRQLDNAGWQEVDAAAVGLGVILLPAAQVIVSWAIMWPFALAVLMSLAGFAAVESELTRGGPRRVSGVVGAGLLYCGAALVYQPGALFAVVLIAGVLLLRPVRLWEESKKLTALHLLVMMAGMLAAFVLYYSLYTGGVFSHESRMQLEHHPLDKLVWFFWNPLPNAVALLPLRDDFHQSEWLFWPSIVGVVVLLAVGRRSMMQLEGETARQRWLICLTVLPVAASLMSLVSAERAGGYREHYALAALVFLLLVAAWRQLQLAGKVNSLMYYSGLGAVLLAMALLAGYQSDTLLAKPQEHEWDLMRGAVSKANFGDATTKVYVIEPARADRSTGRLFGDEFGALSSASPVVAKEMFQTALHERYPGGLPHGQRYEFASGPQPPANKDYDLVIDMRELRHWRR